MKKIFRLSLAGMICSAFFSCKAQPKTLASFIQQKADSALQSGKLPGIFIGVINNGEKSYHSFGFANPDQRKPFDSATVFEIGSITKTFTAYVLECVLRDKKISDSSSILPFLPDSVQKNNNLAPVSFLSLMNHTSGLPRLPENLDMMKNMMAPYDHYTASDLFTYLRTAAPKPDGKSVYSNLGMGLAGVLASRISGQSYASLLDKYIFIPFRLVTPDKAVANSIENKSQGYFEGQKSAYWNMDILAPAGGLKCNAEEVLQYLTEMGKPTDPAAAAIISKLLEPTVALSPKINVCRAWHTLEENDKPVIYWHNGGTYGFSTFAAFTKGGKQAVIVVVNKFNGNAYSDKLGITIMKKMME